MSRSIKLTNCDNYALVDDEDFDWLSKFKWHITEKGYAVCGIYDSTTKKTNKHRMHRFILKADSSQQIDHINRNKLDNRRFNLRVVSGSQNARNIGLSRHNTSGYRWICKDKNRNKWHVSYKLNCKKINVGRYQTLEEAQEAVKKKVLPVMKDALIV